jgi:hypothetical protein
MAALAPTTVAALATVYMTSVPGWYVPLLALLVPAWGIIGLVWLGTLALNVARRGRWARLRREWPVWALPPLVITLVVGSVYGHVPLETCFALSRPALDDFARTVSQGAPLPGDDAWIGLFPIENAVRFPGGVLFAVDGSGLIGATGFAWSPAGEPPQTGGEEAYEHLDGPWYTWWEDI